MRTWSKRLEAARPGIGAGGRIDPAARRGSATTACPGRSGSPTRRSPGVIRSHWSERRHLQHHVAAGTASTPRSCSRRGSTASGSWSGRSCSGSGSAGATGRRDAAPDAAVQRAAASSCSRGDVDTAGRAGRQRRPRPCSASTFERRADGVTLWSTVVHDRGDGCRSRCSWRGAGRVHTTSAPAPAAGTVARSTPPSRPPGRRLVAEALGGCGCRPRDFRAVPPADASSGSVHRPAARVPPPRRAAPERRHGRRPAGDYVVHRALPDAGDRDVRRALRSSTSGSRCRPGCTTADPGTGADAGHDRGGRRSRGDRSGVRAVRRRDGVPAKSTTGSCAEPRPGTEATGDLRRPRRRPGVRALGGAGCRPRTSGSSRRSSAGFRAARARWSGTGPRASTATAGRGSSCSRAVSATQPTGSDWYFDGGTAAAGVRAKLLLPGLGLGRSRRSGSGWRGTWSATEAPT